VGVARCTRAVRTSYPALQLVHHSRDHLKAWRETIVSVIPKPNRADYSFEKNYSTTVILAFALCHGPVISSPCAAVTRLGLAQHQLVKNKVDELSRVKRPKPLLPARLMAVGRGLVANEPILVRIPYYWSSWELAFNSGEPF
jgi:hypothetical protein